MTKKTHDLSCEYYPCQECIDAPTYEQLKEQVKALKERIKEFDESIEAESRDPNGTIWEMANTFLARAEKAEEEAKEGLVEIENLQVKLGKAKDDVEHQRKFQEHWKRMSELPIPVCKRCHV